MRSLPVALGLFAASVALAQQPMPPEQQAEQALTAGQKALNQGDANTAAAKFNEVLQKFGNTRAALGAKFGLAVLQLQSDNPDFGKAVELLKAPAEDGGFADRGQAMYHLAVCQRTLGLKEADKAAADRKFEDARRWFAAARDWFGGQKQDDWAARSRCDQAEAEVRLNKVKDARNTCEPFTKDPALAKNKHRPLGLYYHGLACFLDKDATAAGRSLNQLAPFGDPAFGLHARYLVGRVLHLSGETAEASVHYDAVLAGHETAKAAATEAIKDANKFKGNPFELMRLRALATGPVPEYVAGSAFHTACLKYEAGKFGEAVEKFRQFAKQFEKDPLTADAALRVGFCLVQLKQFDEAVKVLEPLADKPPRLADQVLFWLGKARFGLAQNVDPNNPTEREKQTKAALDLIRKGAEKAREMTQADPDAKARRYDMLFELGDSLFAVKQFKDAAGVYEGLWNENTQLPALRREEVLQRLTAALGGAGDYQRSDDRGNEFRRVFPQSTLTAAVVFRGAENAYARAAELVKQNDRNRAAEAKQKLTEAASRFQEVIDKFPEFDRVNHARLYVGVCCAQTDNLDAAAKALEGIPGPDRSGELAAAAYLLADVLIRRTPTAAANDALEENKAREKLTAAAGMLDSFVGGNPKAPEAPAALLKLAYCQKRLGVTLADPTERNQTLQKGRDALERLRKEYPKDPLAAVALLELAKVKAIQGDRGGAGNDLRSFLSNDATKGDKSAPLAALHLATLYREEGKPADAAKVLEEARKRYEGELTNDKERAEWVPLLKYHHAVAVQESQKPADARKLFDEVYHQSAGKPLSGEAALRAGQCRLAEGRKQTQDGIEARNKAGNDENKKKAAEQLVQQGRAAVADAADVLVRRCDESKAVMPNDEARSRMLYDAAWAFRDLAGPEIQQAVEQAHKEAHAKLPPGSPWPSVPRSQVPPTPFEKRCFDCYKKLADGFADTALSVDGRLEYAEFLAERDAHEEIVKVLKAALDAEPADRPVHPDTTERIRLRLGGSLFARKEYAAAAAQFDAVAGNEKSGHRAQALYRSGESHAAAGDSAKAVEKLTPFRDKKEYQNVGGISDRALVRLGHAQLALKKPDDAKATFEAALNRFGNGNPFAAEARYGLGLVQQAKGQLDEAVKAFEQVVAATQTEVAAKAQLQIGRCRMAQKKYADATTAFLVVSYTYAYPDLSRAAVMEAAAAMEEDKKPAEAEKLLTKLLKDTPPDSDWHRAAKERLAKIKASGGR